MSFVSQLLAVDRRAGHVEKMVFSKFAPNELRYRVANEFECFKKVFGRCGVLYVCRLPALRIKNQRTYLISLIFSLQPLASN